VPTVRSGEIDLHYVRSGAGPRLLFLNGTGTTLANSGPLIDLFAPAFDVVAFEQRGLGESSLPSGPYGMADLAADALALTRHLGWDRFRLAGISFGGMVAQELAVTAPERIERLALLCTSPGGAGGSSYPLDTLTDLPLEERAAISAAIVDTRFTPEWLAAHDGDRALVQALAQHFAQEKPAEVLQGEAYQLGARKHHDVFDRLPRITCPTLVACGSTDGIAPAVNGAAIAAQIPGATLRTFEGGHLFFVQDPAAFPAVIEFLGGD
jgi:3-oxoadipate enol-lactonase